MIFSIGKSALRLSLVLLLLLPGTFAQAATQVAWIWDGAALPPWPHPQIALVVRHILLRDNQVLQRPRSGALPLAGTTVVTPVVHVEISGVKPPHDIRPSHDFIVSSMVQAASSSTSGWVQLDMEARPSQRLFYLGLVHDIHRVLPPNVKLSVTALAWWCRSTNWLDTLDADEVVPMFFRMGRAETDNIRQTVEKNPEKMHARCQQGVAGFSIQEPFAKAVSEHYAKTYWFDSHRWHDAVPLP